MAISIERYSAIAKFELLINDTSIRVAQIAPDFIVVDTPLVLPPGPATLVIDVEGKITRNEIMLPSGAAGDSCFIPITDR